MSRFTSRSGWGVKLDGLRNMDSLSPFCPWKNSFNLIVRLKDLTSDSSSVRLDCNGVGANFKPLFNKAICEAVNTILEQLIIFVCMASSETVEAGSGEKPDDH